MKRSYDRAAAQMRPLSMQTDFVDQAEGSVLIRAGRTVVLCNATVEDRVPGWLRGTGSGWITGEYSMLPRATDTRGDREIKRGRPAGRSQEIERLIGRALRQSADLELIGERKVIVDCDVLSADGSTRTTSITGGWVALALALAKVAADLPEWPLTRQIASVAVGLVDGEVLADLDYEEDSDSQVDLNLVFTSSGDLVEIQGTAEGAPFPKSDLDRLLEVGWEAVQSVFEAQREALAERFEAAGLALP